MKIYSMKSFCPLCGTASRIGGTYYPGYVIRCECKTCHGHFIFGLPNMPKNNEYMALDIEHPFLSEKITALIKDSTLIWQNARPTTKLPEVK